MSEYRRKTLRSFYCEDALWKSFERMSRERDMTIDQLLTEALQGFLDAGGAVGAAAPGAASPAPATPAAMGIAPTLQSASQPGIVDRTTMSNAPVVRGAAPPPPPARPPAPRMTPTPPAAGTSLPRLFLHYGGRVHPVNKEQFVIGRGSQATDLTIRDGNISRKHALVIFHNGAFFMQDLGSTNGVEFNGQRIENKHIEEGDTFTICDHEITFSYRG